MLLRHARLLSVFFIWASASAAVTQDIVLGASVQLTGPVTNTGRYYHDAYQIAIDKINAAGGVKLAGWSHKLVLKLYDNQSDVNLSVRQYTRLVSEDKVNLLLGPFASTCSSCSNRRRNRWLCYMPTMPSMCRLRTVRDPN